MASVIQGENLKICRKDDCGGDNHDGGTVTVKTSATNTEEFGSGSLDPDEGCGTSVACVESGVPSTSVSYTDTPGNHLLDQWLVIE